MIGLGNHHEFLDSIETILMNFVKLLFIKKGKMKNMNKQESGILRALLREPFINQRILAEVSGHSLGVVNRYYVDENGEWVRNYA